MSLRFVFSPSGFCLEVGPFLHDPHADARFSVAVFWSGVEFYIPGIGQGWLYWNPLRWAGNNFYPWIEETGRGAGDRAPE